MTEAPQVLTVGHSTHPIDRFLDLLAGADVAAVADVRRHPGSRRNPQFGGESLAAALGKAGVVYERFGEELGGRRRAGGAGRRAAGAEAQVSGAASRWRNPSFAAYAQYTETPEFAAGLERLEALARGRRTAIMCAEALWWRCHRRLIADSLTERGWIVLHLGADGRLAPHPATLPESG